MANRRPSPTHNLTGDRPRVKGWRDASCFEGYDRADETELASLRAAPAPRRATPASGPRPVAQVGRLLTPRQTESARAIMRLFLKEDLAHGVPADQRLLCQCCGQTKWAAGYVLYGRSAFCNDCATELELSRLRGRCDSAAEFLAWRAEQAAG